ncbi:hypothetical protein [Aminipila sp.]|jgi:hypothetical protein|uniref:hypothetical protein n=1 Tax=Aminipila sp. TaxID=2060095 RepID=UPI001D46247C|nr:hypothetical protein [Aminipila sp.]MBE6033785.1 hypothetical protein [Clostridiales bacterium]
MSLFLGKIHYWLYNKILWAEKAEEEIIDWAKDNSLPVEQWIQQYMEEYGQPTGKHALEEIIDQSNIHGWLQERIKSAELRQAALITKILENNQDYKKELVNIFQEQGKAAAHEYAQHPDSPEGMFHAINDFILEGMPCDRASEVLSSDKNEIVWKISTQLHEPYWIQVKGDIKNFYDLRDAWISSFIETLNSDFSYNKTEDGKHIIKKG